MSRASDPRNLTLGDWERLPSVTRIIKWWLFSYVSDQGVWWDVGNQGNGWVKAYHNPQPKRRAPPGQG